MEDPHLTSIRKFVSYHIYAGGYEGKCRKNIAFIIAKASLTYLLSIENCVVGCKTGETLRKKEPQTQKNQNSEKEEKLSLKQKTFQNSKFLC